VTILRQWLRSVVADPSAALSVAALGALSGLALARVLCAAWGAP